MANPIRKVVGRVKTVAREVMDVPRALGTSIDAQTDYRQGNPADRALMKQNLNRASKNWDRQLAEVAKAILKGEPGTTSDTMKGYTEYVKGEPRAARRVGTFKKIERNK